jgi:hypothetical protein
MLDDLLGMLGATGHCGNQEIDTLATLSERLSPEPLQLTF